MAAARIAINTAKCAAIVWIDAVAVPKPGIDKLLFVENGLELFFDVFRHLRITVFLECVSMRRLIRGQLNVLAI